MKIEIVSLIRFYYFPTIFYIYFFNRNRQNSITEVTLVMALVSLRNAFSSSDCAHIHRTTAVTA